MQKKQQQTQHRWLARVHFSSGYIELTPEWKWVPSDPADEVLELAASSARLKSHPLLYTYSPADGQPGALLAHRIAEGIGGKVELPEMPPGKPWTIY